MTLKHHPFTILLHIALVIILTGAIVTHFAGIQGKITLDVGESTDKCSVTAGPGNGTMPFTVTLLDTEILYYPATTTPMDFRSRLSIAGKTLTVAMNQVGEMEGWRFYQTAIGNGASTLSISYDPWGTATTYTGYILLGVGMAGFFFQKKTPWRALLRSRKTLLTLSLALASSLGAAAGELPAMQRPLASNLGKIYVYWNDRICPMQTMARDVSMSLYGSETYDGLTSEQVLSGWLFYFDEWKRDFMTKHPQADSLPDTPHSKQAKKTAERIGLIQWLGTGESFRIYPYRTVAGHTEWLSLTGRRPSGMELEQWIFMQTTMPRIKELLIKGKNIQANEMLTVLKQGQQKYAGKDVLPAERKMEAERIYNSTARPAAAGIVAFLLGIFFFAASAPERIKLKKFTPAGTLLCAGTWLYISAIMGVSWWISGHVPLSNGPETMLFMAWVAIGGTMTIRRSLTVRGCLCIVGGMALMVAAMGGRTPRIGMMTPVLSSPLLSVHVMLVMISYVLFMLMAIMSAYGLCIRSEKQKESLSVTNRLILTPAICLLGAGIFIGAVWANQSWGRYWGWDPKETCALATWLIYALPAHWGCRRLKCFRKPDVLHRYLLTAILSVAFTYFGANYLLPGLHSYA